MNGPQLMGLDNVGTEIYNIPGYFCELTVGQRTPDFWGVTNSELLPSVEEEEQPLPLQWIG